MAQVAAAEAVAALDGVDAEAGGGQRDVAIPTLERARSVWAGAGGQKSRAGGEAALISAHISIEPDVDQQTYVAGSASRRSSSRRVQ